MATPYVHLALECDDVIDELVSLKRWAEGDQQLAGRIHLESSQAADSLALNAGILDTLVIYLAPGIPVALTHVLASWFKNRTSTLSVKLTRADGTSLELDGQRLSRLGPAELEEIARSIEGRKGNGADAG